MIDWDAPIELDNGARAEVIKIRSDGSASVRIWHDYYRTGKCLINPSHWNYNADGTFSGGNRTYEFFIVNSGPRVIEDWRL